MPGRADTDEHRPVPVIFYVGRAREGAPAAAFGLTTRPEEMWHLVMDALERSPFPG